MELSSPNLVCGYFHSISLDYKGNVFTFGRNNLGQLGFDKEYETISSPKYISCLTNICMISCGEAHSICLNNNGKVFGFGNNYNGQLGLENKEDFILPQKINLPPITQINCGSNCTFCISNDKLLWSFGYGSFGQLGIGNYDSQFKPTQVPNLSDVEYVTSGEDFTICKLYSGKIYSWGLSRYGQLGQGTTHSTNIYDNPVNLPDNIKSIKCGKFHTLSLSQDGIVYVFGSNLDGQIGLAESCVTQSTPVKLTSLPIINKIECGLDHSFCIDIDNNIWAFGFNSYGQLGFGNKSSYNNTIQKNQILGNIIDISSGGYHTFVKTIDNKIYAFGNNKYSQLGIKTEEENQIKPIQVFIDKEEIWCSFKTLTQKSARK